MASTRSSNYLCINKIYSLYSSNILTILLFYGTSAQKRLYRAHLTEIRLVLSWYLRCKRIINTFGFLYISLDIEPSDVRWVGAWWLLFFLSAFVYVFLFVAFSLYGSELPCKYLNVNVDCAKVLRSVSSISLIMSKRIFEVFSPIICIACIAQAILDITSYHKGSGSHKLRCKAPVCIYMYICSAEL